MRKPTKKSLTRELDKVCSLIVRQRPCDKCGEVQYDKLQCAHIFSRTYRSTRFDLLNLLCLCQRCHFWGHKNPLLFSEFVFNYLGAFKYHELKDRHQMICRRGIDEMLALLNNLKKQLNKDDNLV